MTDLIQNYQQEINKVCQQAGISYLAVFGSQARDEASPNSDVDFLVEFEETPSLVSFIRTKQQFEEILERKVDLVTKKGLSKYLRPYIKNDLRKIYG
jgi:uncharacterized protein